MGTKRYRTNFPGVRYREHPTRRHGVRKDKYFAIRAQVDGQRREGGLGWASRKRIAQKAASVLAEGFAAARAERKAAVAVDNLSP
jgi:hypothetical protein